MELEKAEKIVEMIAKIAKGEAMIADNIAWESTENAEHNRKITEKYKQELIELLVTSSPTK